ncbi:MAG: glycosyltransferase family 9 protein [Thermodesulfobacteriota bacterium]
MEIVVINLMRLGDLVQTSAVLRGLKARFPDARLTLLVMDVFQEPATLLAGVDRLLTFPSVDLARLLNEAEDWPRAYQMVDAWLADHLRPAPDLVINLTPTLVGALLASAIQAPQVRGLAVDQRRQFYTYPSWTSYFLIVSQARRANPFNLVDLFLLGADLPPDGLGLHLEIPPEAQAQADAALAALNLPAGTARVGLLPGASDPRRCWPPENFAQTARQLLAARPCHFFVFGSTAEAHLGERLKELLPPESVTLFLGRTSLPLLTAYLNRLDLLICNDTGPMHLAAAVNTPVLALFLASARVQDTGPVGRGHLALGPRLDCYPCAHFCSYPKCYQAIPPQAVSAWALHLLEKKPLTPIADAPLWRDHQVYLSTFDPLGYHAHLPLVRRPLEAWPFWTWVHRAAWPAWLGGHASSPKTLHQWLAQVLTTHYLPPEDDLGLAAGQQALGELLRLTAQGKRLARQISRLAPAATPSPARLWQKTEAIMEIDPQLRRLAVGFPEIAAFIEFFFQEQRINKETELLGLAKDLGRAYGQLHQAGEICLEAVRTLISFLPGVARISPPLPGLAQGMQEINWKEINIQ